MTDKPEPRSPQGVDKELPAPAETLRRSALGRGARLLGVPLSGLGRSAVGLGRRALGADRDAVNADIRDRNAAQLFAVLGELKGGAMKVGQALSLLESVLPEEQAAPYRQQLRRLQSAAPPMPSAQIHRVLADELGSDWQSCFSSFDPRPAAAASIGQVHRAVWRETGVPVAVKVQYPGAEEALRADLRTISRLSGVASPFAQGMDVQAIAEEIGQRIIEEVDYRVEAAHQAQAAQAFADDDEVVVPAVLAHTRRVIVSQWLDGRPLAEMEACSVEDRNLVGLRYARFLFRGPAVAHLLHGDPHPGNFLVLPDRRLGILDWGLTARLNDGLPRQMGRLLRRAQRRDAAAMAEGLRAEGFVTREVDAAALLEYLLPFVEPAETPTFHFNRDWMRGQFRRITGDSDNQRILASLNLPPEYLMLHRVWLGGVAVLSQLDCTAPFAAILDEFLPGW